MHVRELMHQGDRLPIAPADAPMSEALVVMTEKSFGCLGVTDAAGALAGIVTDGDLRRHMGPDLLSRRVGEVMTRSPKAVAPDTLAGAAMQAMNASRITALFVVENGRPVGILHVHDLLRAGVA
jgi:arabinose-5-phosphate isomerase